MLLNREQDGVDTLVRVAILCEHQREKKTMLFLLSQARRVMIPMIWPKHLPSRSLTSGMLLAPMARWRASAFCVPLPVAHPPTHPTTTSAPL
jgi:hypothetical protein